MSRALLVRLTKVRGKSSVRPSPDGFGRFASSVGKSLLVIGLVIAAIGAAIMLGVPLGRLPGDIAVKRGNFSFYFPLTTSIVLSILLTLLLSWFRR